MPVVLMLHDVAAGRLLSYRTSRLDAALANANISGYRGLRFPWESAHTGLNITACLFSLPS